MVVEFPIRKQSRLKAGLSETITAVECPLHSDSRKVGLLKIAILQPHVELQRLDVLSRASKYWPEPAESSLFPTARRRC